MELKTPTWLLQLNIPGNKATFPRPETRHVAPISAQVGVTEIWRDE